MLVRALMASMETLKCEIMAVFAVRLDIVIDHHPIRRETRSARILLCRLPGVINRIALGGAGKVVATAGSHIANRRDQRLLLQLDPDVHLTAERLDPADTMRGLNAAVAELGCERALAEVVATVIERTAERSGPITGMLRRVVRAMLDARLAAAWSRDTTDPTALVTWSADTDELDALLTAAITSETGWRVAPVGPTDDEGALRTAATTLELAGLVLDEAEVAFVPGEAFGAPGYARFSFALADADLEEGLRRLQELAS